MNSPNPGGVNVKTSSETIVHIECLPETMDEIRQYALHGSMRLRAQGGVEVGGVLFGSQIHNGLRIQTWRPIECEHSSGPGFSLSEKELATLQRQLDESKSNPDLSGVQAVGWFVSHTRTGAGLTDGDAALFQRFFSEPWQITLLLHPFRESAIKAAFYVREPDGTLHSSPSLHDVVIEPLSLDTSPAKVVERIQVLDPPRNRLPDLPKLPELKGTEYRTAQARVDEPKPGDSKPVDRRPEPELFAMQNSFPEGRQVWVWSFMGLLLIVVAVVLTWKTSKPSQSIAFHVVDSGGQLLLQWDRNAAPIRKAVRGTLDIKDGNTTIQLPLDAARLKEGSFRYTRKSGDQEVAMNVYPADGAPVQESARFVGPPPAIATPDETTQLRQERDDLASQVARLREQLKAETSRREKLEEQVHAPKKQLAGAKARAKKRRAAGK